MSCRLLTAAWQSPLAPRQKLVLMGFADQAGDDGETAPDLHRLAAASSVTLEELQAIILDLELAGYLFHTGETNAGHGVYLVRPDMLTIHRGG